MFSNRLESSSSGNMKCKWMEYEENMLIKVLISMQNWDKEIKIESRLKIIISVVVSTDYTGARLQHNVV